MKIILIVYLQIAFIQSPTQNKENIEDCHKSILLAGQSKSRFWMQQEYVKLDKKKTFSL